MRQRVHDDLLAQQSLARSLVARLWRQRRLPPSAGAHPTSMEENSQASPTLRPSYSVRCIALHDEWPARWVVCHVRSDRAIQPLTFRLNCSPHNAPGPQVRSFAVMVHRIQYRRALEGRGSRSCGHAYFLYGGLARCLGYGRTTIHEFQGSLLLL